jgi:Mrp family chromosome partitioning ATPase/capsular polysaccharide biosynthesis protein
MRDDEGTPTGVVTMSDYLNVVRRRIWVIVLVMVLVFVAAMVISTRQQAKYSASAHVIEPRLSTTGSTLSQLQRSAEAEASLARAPAIAANVIREVGADMSTDEFLTASSVTSAPDSDVLVFTVRAASPALVVKLVNAYAHEFSVYRSQVARTAFASALSKLEESIEQTEEELARARANAGGEQSVNAPILAPRYLVLLDEQQRLFSAESLSASALVSVPAERAIRIGPHPLRNALLGLALGVVLGIVLAFVREALDPRVRSAGEVGERLGLPLLARVPPPPRPLASRRKLVMLERPGAREAEPFRILRTNLDFANMRFGGRTIMLTSASEREGRTTVLANLGIAVARSGRRVILVDLDLRRPGLGPLFELGDRPGVTDVALNRLTFEDALVPIPLGADRGAGDDGEASDEWREIEGTLEVLPAGSPPPDPGDFIGTQSLRQLLYELGERGDVVLVDSPPLLTVADAVTLSAKVDAVIVTVPVDASRNDLDELRRVLDVCPAPKLGYIFTSAEVEAPYARDAHPSGTAAGDAGRGSRRPVVERR